MSALSQKQTFCDAGEISADPESGHSQALAKYPLNATGCHVRRS